MADFNFARGKSEPINRHGVDNVQYAGSEGDLVSIQDDGSGNIEVVQADAVNGPALGVLFSEPKDPAAASSALDGLELDLLRTNDYTLLGDRVGVLSYGVELTNDDADTNFGIGSRVYLAEGGGYTATEPATSGSTVQVVGVCLGQDENGKDRIRLNVADDYETVV